MKGKKLKWIIILIFSLGLTGMNAQVAITTSGGNASGSGGSSSYSIGQVNYISATGTTGSINQGVQQPYEFYSLGIDDFPNMILMMAVYPNPTTDFITLKIENYSFEQMNCQLFDLRGRLISDQKIVGNQTQIQMGNLEYATYFLKILENNKLLKTFKVIKKN